MTAHRTTPRAVATVAKLAAPAQEASDTSLREWLGGLRALLVISLLMTESVDEDQILDLAASSAQGLVRGRQQGRYFLTRRSSGSCAVTRRPR
jgi:hypothetical protein